MAIYKNDNRIQQHKHKRAHKHKPLSISMHTSIVKFGLVVFVLGTQIKQQVIVLVCALEEPSQFLQLIARRKAHRDDPIGDVHHIETEPRFGLKALLFPINQFLV